MRFSCFHISVAVVAIAITGHCYCQDVDLSFDGGPCGDTVIGDPGSVQSATLDCVLSTSNNPGDGGAQGWSISVASRGGEITAITTDGTVGADVAQGGLRSVGFEKSELTTRSGVTPGGGNDCEGLNGAVSAVVLSFVNPITLDPEGSAVIARVDLDASAPAEAGACSGVEVFFADGCRGAGQPVRNAVTLDAQTIIPSLGTCGFEVCAAEKQDARPAAFELSFSGDNDETITGLFGLTFSQTIDCTLTTSDNETELGAQGWSISLAPDEGLDIIAISIDGTVSADVADGGLRQGGFEKSELTEGEGNVGAVSAVVLGFAELVMLPLSGTEVIARLDIQCPYPGVDVTETKVVRYVDGLSGSGQPVDNVVAQADFDIQPATTAYEVTLRGIDENAITYDCNTDGRVNIADAQCLLNWLFLGGPSPGCLDAVNFNGDDRLNIADGISGLNFLFLGGPPPPAGMGCQPYPDCENEASCL